MESRVKIKWQIMFMRRPKFWLNKWYLFTRPTFQYFFFTRHFVRKKLDDSGSHSKYPTPVTILFS